MSEQKDNKSSLNGGDTEQMVRSNLAILMAKKKIRTLVELSEKTGISRTTLTSMYYERGKGVQFATLDALCAFFNVEVGEIIQCVDEVV